MLAAFSALRTTIHSAVTVVVVVVVALTHHYNAVRRHRTGSNVQGTGGLLQQLRMVVCDKLRVFPCLCLTVPINTVVIVIVFSL